MTSEVEAKFNWLIGSHKRRTLIALYHDHIPYKERLSFIKNFDASEYISDVKENSIQGQFYQWALKRRLFRLYDFARSSIIKIK